MKSQLGEGHWINTSNMPDFPSFSFNYPYPYKEDKEKRGNKLRVTWNLNPETLNMNSYRM